MITSTPRPVRVSTFARNAAGALGGGAAAVALYGWSLDAAGVPMRAGGPGATVSEPVTPATFATGTAILTVVAIGLAMMLRRRASAPRRAFLTTTVALAAASLVLPLTAGATAASTKVWFAVGHVVIAALILPILARALPTRHQICTRGPSPLRGS